MRSYSYWLIGLALAVFAGELASILVQTAGHFTYTLDDPYISLAVAENLARFGHYGINLGESSSPCSSILYPLLLAPFCLARSLAPWGPLILDLPCALISLLVIRRIIRDSLSLDGEYHPRVATEVVAPLLLFLLMNGFAVVFTGLEHSIQTLVTLLTVLLINRVHGRHETSPAAETPVSRTEALGLFLCIWLGPLVRFEGLVVAALAVGLLVAIRRYRLALAGTAAVLASYALYFQRMAALHLPLLPSSVLVKSPAMADALSSASFLHKVGLTAWAIGRNVRQNLVNPEAALLIALAVLLAMKLRWPLRWRAAPRQSYITAVLVTIAAHFAFGRFGWYGRYEDYIYALALGALIHVYGGGLVGNDSPLFPGHITRFGGLLVLAVGALLMSSDLSLTPLLTTPLAAKNIYLQQYQMHRFAVDYWRKPVAVNDIGYVSFENDNYVLDMEGLGSEQARKLDAADVHDGLQLLVRQHEVGLAMIYAGWFAGRIPASWHRIARLSLGVRRVTVADGTVSFYLTGAQQNTSCAAVLAELKEFSLSLPPGARLALVSSCTA